LFEIYQGNRYLRLEITLDSARQKLGSNAASPNSTANVSVAKFYRVLLKHKDSNDRVFAAAVAYALVRDHCSVAHPPRRSDIRRHALRRSEESRPRQLPLRWVPFRATAPGRCRGAIGTRSERRISSCDRRIRELYRTSELCQKLGEIEGVGPVTATALVAAVGDQSCFRNGRQFAAWLGLVPKQRSSGGRYRLFGISKRGDRYLRTLMIHGARAALGKAGGKQDSRSRWLASLRQRRHPNVAAVALANKNARIVWAMLAGNLSYEPARSVQAA